MKNTALIVLNRNKRRKKEHPHSIPRLAWSTALALSLFFTIILAIIVVISVNLLSNLPSLEELAYLLDDQHGILLQPTRFYDRTGTELLASFQPGGVERSWLQASNPDKSVNYLDLQSPLARAFYAYYEPKTDTNSPFSLIKYFKPQLSTIADRLAYDILLWREPNSTIKILRAKVLAAQITGRFGKGQVLVWFLNCAKFGPYLYGADTAAKVYFGKPANQLNLAESAALVAISDSPSIHPLNAPQLVKQRAGEILNAMLNSHLIQIDELSQTNLDNLHFNPTINELDITLPPFIPLAEKQLASLIPVNRLEMGGMKVITSIDADLQKNAVCVSNILIHKITNIAAPDEQADCPASLLIPTIIPNIITPTNPLAANLIILDIPSGQTLALVSVEQKSASSALMQNAPLSIHPAGSILSPFIYLSAFARGHQPASLEWDIPIPELAIPPNLDNQFHGPLRARIALANDLLSPAAQLFQQIGSETIINTTKQMGIPLKSLTNSSKANIQNDFIGYLNTQISIIDIAQAYSIFANQGSSQGLEITIPEDATSLGLQPIFVLSVLDSNGNALPSVEWNNGLLNQEKSVISPQLAYLMTNVLSDESARWLVLGHPNFFEIGRTAAAKLGRTIGQDQYWAIGYTPQRLVGVWLGKMNATSPQSELASGSMAIWYAMTQYSSQNLPAQSWETPPNIQKITVCDPSGLLPDEDCPTTVNEVFLAGFEPHQTDNLFQTLPINEQTGRLATVFTPFELVKEKTFMNIPPQAQAWAKSANIAIPPTEYDVIQTPANLSSCVRITSPAMFAFVHGKVKIMGSTDCAGFHYYRLQLGKGLFPRAWLQIGSDVTQTVKEGELGEWDTSGLDGLYTLQLQVVGEENQVQTALIQITVDNVPPTISILYPADGEMISASEYPSLTFQFQAYDDIAVKQVAIYLDGKNIYNLVQPPFAVPWQTIPGKHHLKAIVIDQASNQTVSEITFTVKP